MVSRSNAVALGSALLWALRISAYAALDTRLARLQTSVLALCACPALMGKTMSAEATESVLTLRRQKHLLASVIVAIGLLTLGIRAILLRNSAPLLGA